MGNYDVEIPEGTRETSIEEKVEWL